MVWHYDRAHSTLQHRSRRAGSSYSHCKAGRFQDCWPCISESFPTATKCRFLVFLEKGKRGKREGKENPSTAGFTQVGGVDGRCSSNFFSAGQLWTKPSSCLDWKPCTLKPQTKSAPDNRNEESAAMDLKPKPAEAWKLLSNYLVCLLVEKVP